MKGFKQGAQCGEGVISHGEAMGFKKGGQVKSSPQFLQKTSKQDSMDDGVQPARKGRNQAEVEAGGTKRMLPGYKVGGKVDGYTRANRGGKACYMKGGEAYMMKGGKMCPMDMKAMGGAVRAGAGGAKRDPAGKNRVMSASKSEGQSKPPVGRGSKTVGKGGETGKHRTGRLTD